MILKKKGCFLVNTSLEFKFHDSNAQGVVTRGFKEFEAFFRRGIEVSQARGEMSSTLDSSATAKALFALVVSIRILGRGVYKKIDLNDIAVQAMRLTF